MGRNKVGISTRLPVTIYSPQHVQNKNSQITSRNVVGGDYHDVIERDHMDNARFSAYYKAQKIIPENEWNVFMDSLRRYLPTTFRVSGSRE